MDEVDRWLHLLFGHIEGWIELRAITDTEKGGPLKEMCGSTLEASHVIEEWREREGLNIFAGMCTRMDPQTQGIKTNLHSAGSLWLDIDLPNAIDSIGAKVSALGNKPTMIVHSGGGRHLYWAFDEAKDVSVHAGVLELEETLRGLIDYFGADTACFDATRIMRVAGTTNYPFTNKKAAGRKVEPCTILESDAD